MTKVEEIRSLRFDRRKSDIHCINTYMNEGCTTSKVMLEERLRTKILKFRAQSSSKKLGYRNLREYLSEQFYTYLIANNVNEPEIELLISQCIPSHTSIRNFLHGKSLSMKHLDSMARVFDITYIITNFYPDTFLNHADAL